MLDMGYGPTWVVGIAGIMSGVVNCLIPSAALYSFWLFFVLRIINGFCAGAMLPSMTQVLRYWVPPTERHYFMWAYCGITTGTCSTFLICAAVQYYSKWSVGFLVGGTIQVLWATLWLVVVNDSPDKHSFVSKYELDYLKDTIGSVTTIHRTNSQAPWKLILRSVPFWCVCILNFGFAWLIIAVCLHGPLYYSSVLKYTIYEASALTALPFLLRLIFGTLIIQTYHWYKNTSRPKMLQDLWKYVVVVSHVVPGLLISMVWVIPVNPGPTMLTIAVVLTAAAMDITLDLCYELSPTYVNSMNTLIKIIGNLPGIVIPLCVGEVTNKLQKSLRIWKYVWAFHGTILLLSGIIFLMWGDITIQEWNNIRHRPNRLRKATVRPSVMSNITEIDEDESSNRVSFTPKKSKLVMISTR
ncbi:vesicular glutamate transporter 1-like [Leptidea sinapis]|uniref:vesicular glutamate transporter 1-like n=1 Tax=Leptidea sinapis TaxID=189913 RepID=UPI0021C4AAF6|nr:vesicular glutamate transporter 1-like [Leptidea sinapis]